MHRRTKCLDHTILAHLSQFSPLCSNTWRKQLEREGLLLLTVSVYAELAPLLWAAGETDSPSWLQEHVNRRLFIPWWSGGSTVTGSSQYQDVTFIRMLPMTSFSGPPAFQQSIQIRIHQCNQFIKEELS